MGARKLTWEDVREIRRRSREGETLAALAREYEVSSVCVHGVAVGRTWRNDPEMGAFPLKTDLRSTGQPRIKDHEANFKSKLRIENDCWIWAAGHGNGSPVFWVNQAYHLAYRFAYEMAVGKLGPGQKLYRACASKSCVNPAHYTFQRMRRSP